MGRTERVADGLDNAHRGIVAFRCHQHIVSRRQQFTEEKFHTCLAVTAGNADHFEVGRRINHPFRVINIPVVDRLFNRLVQPVGSQQIKS